jgi:predicted DnaQ family exonuclease/DinG family helicase
MPRKKKEHKSEITEARKETGPLAFVAVDIETTGLNWERDQIIEIGAARFENGQPAGKFQALVNPERKLSHFIKRLTGIIQEEVDAAPLLDEAMPGFMDFIGDSVLVLHNGRFDLSFLGAVADIPNRAWDTLTLARCLLPRNRSHSKDKLCRHFGIETGRSHRAYDDALATGHLFLRLAGMIPELDPLTLDKMHRLALTDHKGLLERFKTARLEVPAFSQKSEIPQTEPEKKSKKKVDQLNRIFSREGELAGILGGDYEERPEQAEMAEKVMSALDQEHFLLAEAGTGTGKSLAYLAPAAVWARKRNQRVVISTHTKNLQEQLFYKDIPLLREAAGPFQTALLKGRSNYLCLRRWQEVSFHPELFLSEEEREEALILVPWSLQTATGDISEHRGFNPGRAPSLWGKVCSEAVNCQNNRCPLFSKCFLRQARKKAEQAHLIVVNHSLLFSDLSDQSQVLPEYDRLIIDEAHNIERVATDLLGYGFSRWDLWRLLQGLYTKRPSEGGLLVSVSQWVKKNGKGSDSSGSLQQSALDIAKQALEAGKLGERFLGLKIDLEQGRRSQEKKRYLQGDSLQTRLFEEGRELVDLLLELAQRLAVLQEALSASGLEPDDERELFTEELTKRSQECRSLGNMLARLVQAEERGYIFWAEPGSWQNDLRLVAGPLEVGGILDERLYQHLRTAVFTSATLTVESDFGFFRSRVGLDLTDRERVNELRLASPFDFRKQAALLVPQYLPSPKVPVFGESFIAMLQEVLARHRTGGLVLFTAFDLLNRSYRHLLEAGQANILAQGIDGHPSQLVEQSLTNKETVIFGTNSFWEGVDLPGQALELLVIAKLPFSVPNDPLVEARCQAIESSGGSSFHQYLLPEAVIRFRQGFGRLIRNKTDRGLVIVADSRITNTEYGKTFIRSLPALPVIICRNAEELISNVSL